MTGRIGIRPDDATLLLHVETTAAASEGGARRRRDSPRHTMPRMTTSLDRATASAYARCALQSLARSYPHALQHLMRDPDDHARPEQLHPIFHGSYDWHSSAHMQWSLVRLLRLAPDLPERAAIVERFERLYTSGGADAERAYLQAHPGFERPYGWAWLLVLQSELASLATLESAAARWAGVLEPLVSLLRQRWIAHLSLAPYPQRAGVHANSAFALSLALVHARARSDTAFVEAIRAAAGRWFGNDRAYPAAYEPSATDFLSGGLCEAVLMQASLGSGVEFARWWRRFRPEDEALTRWAVPAPVVSRTDAQLVHADGLNLSRAWCLGVLAGHLPEERARFETWRQRHLDAALPHVSGGDFVATHWLVSFALLARTGLTLRAATATD